jgi:cytidylate kinase
MIISIGGQAGSGKSSVAEMLAKRLGFRHYSMGDLRRRAAYEKGMTLAGFNRLGEKDPFTDRFVDELQERLGKEEDNFVVDGRTSFHFIPRSVKIYLHADLEVRARRVLKDERKTEKFNTLRECKNELVERERSDNRRYRKYYRIDPTERKNYDYWIDTTDMSVRQIVDSIIGLIRRDYPSGSE